MLYHVYELTHAAMSPLRAAADAGRLFFRSPFNPVAYTSVGRRIAAACDVFNSTTRRYGKPAFGLDETKINGLPVPVTEEIVWRDSFCQLKRFKRDEDLLQELGSIKPDWTDPKVLIVAPLSGHYATLLRGTVEAMLPEHDVYITDWRDARMVPPGEGVFDLNTYIDYVMAMLRHLGRGTHVVAVCQPGPAVLSAAALMAEEDDPAAPASMIIMGSPIDARKSPTEPNRLAESRPYEWFEENMVSLVPFPHPGAGRAVYPGFLQLGSFIAMNQKRHVEAHYEYFKHLVEGDGDSAQKHRTFYDEYLAVLDLAAEFYLQTIDVVFQRHLLPKGEFYHHNRLVDPAAIRKTALMTVEGELDDISGIGQTQAAHDICVNIPEEKRIDYIQPGVGHYGVFNGNRFRTEIQPRMRDFIRSNLIR